MTRVPHEGFIRYLISLRLDRVGVNKSLEGYGFNSIGEDYFALIQRELELPEGFNGRDRRHLPSVSCLKLKGILELWYKEQYPFVDKAFEILGKPAVRRLVELLLLTPAAYETIADALRTRFSYPISVDTIAIYARVFCNYSRLTPDQLEVNFTMRGEPWKIGILYGDAELLRYHLGMDTALEMDKVIKEVFDLGYFKIKELKPQGASDKTGRAYSEFLKGVMWGVEQSRLTEDRLKELTKSLKMRKEHIVDVPYGQLPESTQSLQATEAELQGSEQANG